MNRLPRVLAASTVLAMAVSTVVAMSAAAAGTNARLAPCDQAWQVIATEQTALDSGDRAAWARVSDAFIALSDASVDGPLSNALGSVSTAASDYAASLNSDSEGDPSVAAFNSSLAALGTVCAKLAITSHRESVPRFQKFAFQTGTISGLGAGAEDRANAAVAAVTARGPKAAKEANGSPCLGGQRKCAYFVQTLDQRRCLPGYVCVRSVSGLLASGANSGQDWADTWAFDGRTGQAAALSRVVPAQQQAAFVTAVNGAVKAKLAAQGLGKDPFWKPKVTFTDVRAWLPQPDGIHVWFDKYAVAPGFFGIVHIVVPWTAFA